MPTSKPTESKAHILVIGAGVIGLQTALSLLLTDRYTITILAEHLPSDRAPLYTSPWAGAHWRTHALPNSADAEQRDWDTRSYNEWMHLLDNEPKEASAAGLGRYTSHYVWSPTTASTTPEFTTKNDPASVWWASKVRDFSILPVEQLPSGASCGVEWQSVTIDPERYLTWLLARVLRLGGRVVKDKADGWGEAVKFAEVAGEVAAVVNATGLGAMEIAGDETMFPIRGQTLLVRGQAQRVRTWVGEWGIGYVLPREVAEVSVLGGSKEVGSWNQEAEDDLTATILERGKLLAPELVRDDGEIEVLATQVGFRPGREGGPRVEIEELKKNGAKGETLTVLHCYGHSGAG
ncbi:MAG: hypothetical protein M1833_002952 [Piccolia ochrophora]|nr:MAG: hypothetical protein M1833_002952 [Piccolia ochrophora]